MTLVQDAMNASMPGTAKQFLGSVQPKPIGQMVIYLAIISLLPLIGSILGWMIGWASIVGIGYGILYAVVIYIGNIIAWLGAGFVLALLSNGVLGRQISNEEGVTVVGYAATPAIAIGFLSGIVSWMWGLGILAAVIGFLGVLYTGYLIYLGGGARYGTDKSIVAAIVAVVAALVIDFIFGAIAGAVVSSVIWGGYAGLLNSYYYHQTIKIPKVVYY